MITNNQIVTIAWVVGITTLWVFGLLAIEIVRGKKLGSEALITNSFRAAVIRVPWVFILLALISAFLMGHCFGN